jgi:hypothetical protein
VQFGGLRLDGAGRPTPEEVGRAFLSSVLDRAALMTLPLDEEGERKVGEWLGLAP